MSDVLAAANYSPEKFVDCNRDKDYDKEVAGSTLCFCEHVKMASPLRVTPLRLGRYIAFEHQSSNH
ncbi:hypothetical protein RRF57_001722 [Xylaria bambusicola]|uniref:Uncharacterized protein n=1 Tax=Xylaria bambusicola TaxID=326684 RepID=A0AAN7UIY5_9PEZI